MPSLTRPQLRRLLAERYPSVPELMSFLLDYHPEVHRRLNPGMDRLIIENLLLGARPQRQKLDALSLTADQPPKGIAPRRARHEDVSVKRGGEIGRGHAAAPDDIARAIIAHARLDHDSNRPSLGRGRGHDLFMARGACPFCRKQGCHGQVGALGQLNKVSRINAERGRDPVEPSD